MVGNPNVGKTTLFNLLTGQNARVGNYPGITVERKVGTLKRPTSGKPSELVDVPGCYSLSSRSPEEQIALKSVLGFDGFPIPDLVVCVVDAGQLTRNLYLALQLAEFRVPLLIVINMIDEVRDNAIDAAQVAEVFGVPCVPVSARTGFGIDALRTAISEALTAPPWPKLKPRYPDALVRTIDQVAEAFPPDWRRNVEHDRALALWALTSIEEDDELEGIPREARERVLEVHREISGTAMDETVITARYALLDDLEPRFFGKVPEARERLTATKRIDQVLLHPVFGFAIFIVLMLLVFQSLFAWSDPAISLIEAAFSGLSGLVTDFLPANSFRDLLTEGVIGGVGNVVVFLPQILLLFLFIGVLEDSGYMARVAYLMDRIMRVLGLHGRAFVPMLSGFACAVPAVLATRTMERQRDRLLTMLVVPLMTCSARLPVYTLVIAALFPPTHVFGALPVQGLLMIGMYLFSMLVSLIAAWVLGRTVVKGKSVPLILELPPYRLPRISTTLSMMWQRSASFLREAGSVILVCTIVLWALLSFPKPSESTPPAAESAGHELVDHHAPRTAIEQSYGGQLGKLLEPAIAPLGFDWKIGVGIIGAFAAREVFVSTMGLVYGIGDVGDDDAPLREKIKRETRADGSPVYSPLTGLSLMVFFALACQCISTLSVVRRETRSWRWPMFLFGYMTVLAYAASFLVYQGGRLLGF